MRNRRTLRPWLIAGGMALLLFALLQQPLFRAYEALLLLAEIGGVEALPASYAGQEIKRHTIHFQGGGHEYAADIYQTARKVHSVIILQHGAAEDGKSDARLVRLSWQLARAGFTVMVPEMPGARRLRVNSEDIPVLEYAVDYLEQNGHDRDVIGIGGFCIAAGLAVQAALLPQLQERVDFILSFGGYYDLAQSLHYMTTDTYTHDGGRYQRVANEYGKWVFVLSNLDKITDLEQRALLLQIVTEKREHGGLSAELVTQLRGEALAIFRYISNRDFAQAPRLMQQLPEALRAEVARLDLANKGLSRIKARLLLLHGRDDNIIPYTQSIELLRALPPGQAQLYLLDNWVHVDSDKALSSAWPLYRALYHLLELRDGS